ncbi:hypothetical protein [Paenibacillus sp. XY044]|uniref:hypothetical protein n=1 Tax=Paenibacillus sp. XY044 TaxID=2026089 RepID=UPI000B994626|nr:hypothetical protein [Paenibacillus sp. XY044]OZB95003.1 hypothetical protein CJP46_14955 [Paenibacillus sp. XY044]
MKKSINLLNLVFFVPAVILSFVVWNDYKQDVAHIQDRLHTVEGLFYLDGGSKVISLTDSSDGMDAILYDAATHQEVTKVHLRSNIHNEFVSSYQKGNLVIATTDDSTGLQLNVIGPGGHVEELVKGTLEFDGFLSSAVHNWEGRMMVGGKTDHDTFVVGEVRDGVFQTAYLNEDAGLPTRPTSMSEVMGSFNGGRAIPLYELDLKDGSTAYASGLLSAQRKAAIRIEPEGGSAFDAEDQAERQFAALAGVDSASLWRTESNEPKQVRTYDAVKGDWGDVVKTPAPVFQATVFPLNDRETLIFGSTAKDELKGQVTGYLYDRQTRSFTDLSQPLSGLEPKDVSSGTLSFYKEIGDATLYFTDEEKSAGWLNVKGGTLTRMTGEALQTWQIAEGADRISWNSFAHYLKRGNALVINWAIWLLIPLVLFGGLAFLIRVLTGRQKKLTAEGVIAHGTVTRLQETGTYVNEQPMIRFDIRFEDEGMMKETSIKKVVSYLHAPRAGDPVLISYNRKKNRAVFVTGDDLPQTKPEVIRDAVLARIDTYGKAGRGEARLLHFDTGGQTYAIPVVQANGFTYQTGDKADLMQIGGVTRLYNYNRRGHAEGADQLTLEGEVIRIEQVPVEIVNRKLMLFELLLSHGNQRSRKVNSQFVPDRLPVAVGSIIPVSVNKEEYEKELRLLQGKQGSANVTSVQFDGTVGERPFARITVMRNGVSYRIEQSIEPVYGVEVGDDLWIAYDDQTREAVIVQYASA